MISATTRFAAVIGHPIHHSLSPALHNAGFRAVDADWVYAAFDVAPGRAGDALDAMRVLGLSGLSVTMPHKEAVAAAVDELDPPARALRSVNTVVGLPDGRLRGRSTDGAGLVSSLAEAGVAVAGANVCLLGAGGAGRAVADALARAGAAEVAVVNRSGAAAEAAAALAGSVGRVGTMADVRRAELVVNTTSVGMGSSDLPLEAGLLHDRHVVVDIVYHPLRTALLGAAAAAGARTVDGLGMLVHQAALQQEMWTGRRPPTAPMRAAAERELAARPQ